MPDVIDVRVAEVLGQPYHWILQPDDAGYAASVIEFPGCYSGRCNCGGGDRRAAGRDRDLGEW